MGVYADVGLRRLMIMSEQPTCTGLGAEQVLFEQGTRVARQLVGGLTIFRASIVAYGAAGDGRSGGAGGLPGGCAEGLVGVSSQAGLVRARCLMYPVQSRADRAAHLTAVLGAMPIRSARTGAGMRAARLNMAVLR